MCQKVIRVVIQDVPYGPQVISWAFVRLDPLESSILDPTPELWNSAFVFNMAFSIHIIKKLKN